MVIELYAYGLALWLIFIPFAMVNAAFREKVLAKRMKELRAHQASSITFIVLIFLVTLGILKLIDPMPHIHLIILGITWTVLTIIFEFVFGHFVMKHSWKRLLLDYNIIKGRLWSLVLLAILFAPMLMGNL